MITTRELSSLLDGDGDVIGPDGDRLGRIGQVYLDDATGEPAWVTVVTGLFGTSETFVPLDQATVSGDDVQVPYDKQRVKDAPRVDPDGSISPQEELELYAYYGVGGYADDPADSPDQPTAVDAPAPADVPVPDAAAAVGGTGTDEAMTRSEEQLRVTTRTREAGRARLRKYVVTEHRSVTVPVSREEVRIVREPVPEAERASLASRAEISELVHEIVLHEEVPRVTAEAHPVERIRVATRTVTEEQQVTAEVRKERIELETGGTAGAAPQG